MFVSNIYFIRYCSYNAKHLYLVIPFKFFMDIYLKGVIYFIIIYYKLYLVITINYLFYLINVHIN